MQKYGLGTRWFRSNWSIYWWLSMSVHFVMICLELLILNMSYDRSISTIRDDASIRVVWTGKKTHLKVNLLNKSKKKNLNEEFVSPSVMWFSCVMWHLCILSHKMSLVLFQINAVTTSKYVLKAVRERPIKYEIVLTCFLQNVWNFRQMFMELCT